ncbi:MAG: YcjF family protein [Syntrophobacteraceae bacterium]
MKTSIQDAKETQMVEMNTEEVKEQAVEDATAAMEEQPTPRGLDQEASRIVNHHVMWTVGAGMVPIPLVDLVAFTGIQLEMLRRMAKLYDVPFRRDIVKSLVGSLLGGVLPVTFSFPAYSLLKAIPIIGWTTSAVTMSIVGSAATYAIGKVFIMHFESGGTFLDFNPEKLKNYFAEKYAEGKALVSKKSSAA